MSLVKVTFTYDPEEPDEQDSTGISENEYNELMDKVAAIGGYDVEVEKKRG